MKTVLITLLLALFLIPGYSQTLFFDDFEDEDDSDFDKWTTENLEGWQYWHVIDWGGNGGHHCMRFEICDTDQNDWLITRPIDCSGADQLALNFDVLYSGNGPLPKLFYTYNYDGNSAESNWTELSYSLGASPDRWYSIDEIVIDHSGDVIYFAFQYQSTPENALFLLLDNFWVKEYVPEPVYNLIGSSGHFEFYSTSANAQKYWDKIKDNIDQWYVELCSYWDRPGRLPIYSDSEKLCIYLKNKEDIDKAESSTIPKWKYAVYKTPDKMFVAIPPANDPIYSGSFSSMTKNILGQLMLKKRYLAQNNNNLPLYFSEAFGLYYSGYRPVRGQILSALNALGRNPDISDINDVEHLDQGYQKDLLVSYIEGQALSSIGIQNIRYDSFLDRWQHHLTYFYENSYDKRIELRTQTEKFDIYATEQEIPYLSAVGEKLEEKLSLYSSLFDFEVNHRFNCVIYPSSEAGDYCLIVSEDYNGGSGWSGDKLDLISLKKFIGGEEDFYSFLIPHEFFHVFHFNMVKHLFTIPPFYSEGLANYMAGFQNKNYLNGKEQDAYKIKYAFDFYEEHYHRKPNLADLSNSNVFEQYDNYYNDPYYFGELFYKYFIENVGNTIELKNYFLADMDWNVLSKSYSEIDEGYIHFLSKYSGMITGLDIYKNSNINLYKQNNEWTITVNDPDEIILRVEVYDLFGRRMDRQNTFSSQVTFPMQPTAISFYKITTNKQSYVKRVNGNL